MLYANQINQPAAPAPGAPVPTIPAPSMPQFPQVITEEQLGLITTLRQLWMRLAIWSRSLIVSTAADLGDRQQIVERMMLIPEDFSRVLGQYFEPQVADQFRELLEEHISTETALIDAEKSNNDQLVDQETRNWYANASEMAAYLASINPYWSEEEWMDLLDDYIEIVLADLVNRLEGNYAEEISIFDDLESQALKLADYMALGIMERFRP